MSQFHTTILSILHFGIDVDTTDLPKKEAEKKINAAKRELNLQNGGKPAIDAAAKLVEAGVAAEYLCPENKLVGMETMGKIQDLLDGGADATLLQKFSPGEILAGLDETQMMALKPVVEDVTETSVVEVAADAPVVTKTEAVVPKAKVEVEAAKPILYPCASSFRKATADELRIPPFGVLKTMLNTAQLTEQDLIKHANLPDYTRWKAPQFSLTNGLQTLREANTRHAEIDAKKAAFRAFAYDLPRGEVKEYEGVEHIKCGQCHTVAPTTKFRFPLIGFMIDHNPLMIPEQDVDGKPVLHSNGKPAYVVKLDRNGQPICIVPSVKHAVRKFACCSRCGEQKGLNLDNTMDYATAVRVVGTAKAESDAERAANQARWERNQRLRTQGQGNRKGFDMKKSPAEEEAEQLMQDGVYETSSGRRERGSRNDRNRLLDEMVEG